ncbi:glucan endo-1,3-beta-glucosidase-like [Actinidia eriantha]|uniref:glucan endo-1,3-beta-glucosidase-like n=1 Tax=Actinidia eriantha TaxID=165200 RepID=UPI00258FF320|nr:glucan endo-1,3-beta-glucosidase-like [Actinidia eriantha]
MAAFHFTTQKPLLLAALLLIVLLLPTDVQGIGVCNGQLGNDLPSDAEVVALYKANGIRGMRMYAPNPSALDALRGSDIEFVLDVPNQDLPALASNPNEAAQWIQNNVRNYFPDVKFRYISVGNEVNPNDEGGTAQYVQFVLPAMRNVYDAIAAAGLQDQIKVSTATFMALVSNSFPPSNGVFGNAAFMNPIINFLVTTNAPLLANIYPYFGYIDNKSNIGREYALFTSSGVVVQDGEFGYQNLFDAMLDAMYSAVEKAGGNAVEIVVSETGWPSDGGDEATTDNAATYYRNVINHVKSGTPKRLGKAIETYLFAMFDENEKGGRQSERHFGLFTPNQQSKYQLSFN